MGKPADNFWLAVIPVMVACVPPVAAGPIVFAPPYSRFPAGSRPQFMATADLNKDGRLDLVTCGPNSSTVAVMFGKGDGTFQAPVVDSTGPATRPVNITVCDVNNDGNPDLVVVDSYNSVLIVLLGDGTGKFSTPRVTSTVADIYSIALADLNQDGYPDAVAVGGVPPNNDVIQLGKGDGTFGPTTPFFSSAGGGVAGIWDANEDGKLDIVLEHFVCPPFSQCTATFATFLGNGNGGVVTRIDSDPGLLAQAIYPLITGDWNHDGRMDIAGAFGAYPYGFATILGQPDGSFSWGAYYNVYASGMAAADYTSNGSVGFAVDNAGDDQVSFMSNNFAGGLNPPDVYNPVGNPQGNTVMVVGDFNGDTRPDLAVLNVQTASVAIMLNQARPVVLVHGYCGSASDWFDLGTYLSAQGFSPHSPNLTPNNGHPWALVGQLSDYLDKTFPKQDVDVIAHSMGGLVTRQLIRQRQADCRIKTLITLGTPHHGVDLMNLVYGSSADKAFAALASVISPLNCLVHGDGASDLVPGNWFLNRLNYNTLNQVDFQLHSSYGRHQAEYQYPGEPTTWTFVGTMPFNDPAAVGVTARAWLSRQTGGNYYWNDGVVGQNAAVLWRDHLANARIDTDMGLSPIQHYDPSILGDDPLYIGHNAFTSDVQLFPILANVLRGGVPPGTPPNWQPLQAQLAPLEAGSDSVETVIASETGTVTAKQTLERPFVLPSTPYLDVYSVADSTLLLLRKPDGTLLTPADTLSVAGMTYVDEGKYGFAAYHVPDPPSGNWTVVYDASNAITSQGYALGIHVLGTTQVVLTPAASPVFASTVNLQASLQDAGVPQPRVILMTTVVNPDSTIAVVTMYDDGAHNDGAAGDGIYGGMVSLPQMGTYVIHAQAVSGSGVNYFGTTVVEAQQFEDLAVDSTLSFSQNSVVIGDSLLVSGTVRNLGAAAVSNVVVELWDNHVKLESQTLPSLGGGASSGLSFLWHASAPDTHLVEVVVNPFVVPNEANIDNNTARDQIVLGRPITGVGPNHGPSQPQLFLAPAMPNPWTGQTTLRFSLPRNSGASLVVYDVLGRRLKTWAWPTLPAGPHQVVWDGKAESGQSVAPGVLFYCFETTGQILRQKMVHLR
jgi:pimeloyl-ACP methyl ester carboxylesterase